MLSKIMRWSTVLVVTALFVSMSAGMAVAVTSSGMGPDEAMTPGDWAPVTVGEQHWFAFLYDGDQNSIRIEVFANPSNGVQFKVLTEAEVQHWRETGEIKWIGAGAKNNAEKSDLFWTGKFNLAGKYYVLVEHSKQTPGATWCLLKISGKGVTFPGGEPTTAPVAPAGLQPVKGSGPDLAFEPGKWQEVGDGVHEWFAFTYDKHANDPMIEIKLYSKHLEGLSFKIVTPDQANVWRKTGELKFIGVGSANKSQSADLSWKGSFTTSGTYYVVVEHQKTGQVSAWSKIMVSGEGVTF